MAEPTAVPFTTPVVTPTLAIEGDPLLQLPPVVVLLSVIVEPRQTEEGPVIDPGAACTETTTVAKQPEVNIYVIVAVPIELPETRPPVEVTSATPALLVLHDPPGAPSVNKEVPPKHIFVLPNIAGGPAVTVTTRVPVLPEPVT